MINYRLLFITTLIVAALASFGLLRLDINTDVVRSLPTGERIIADGLEIFEHHPIHDQLAVDINLDTASPDALVEIGRLLENKMEESGLFAQVGINSTSELIPEIALYAAQHLPLLFSEKELTDRVAPLLEPKQIEKRIHKLYTTLSTIEGIGQTDFIRLDPLGLKDLVMARMAPLAPSAQTKFYRGSLLSEDSRHLMVVARPHGSGTDTTSAREIADFFDNSFTEISAKYQKSGLQPIFTPVGAYRAALDNERIIRHDVQYALLLATAGIGLLLLFAFPRPLIGLLSLVPALAGISIGIFVYSLFHSTISIMVIGFGGAVISITVDHGIAYLLFLDRSHETKGKDASLEVRAIGIMAALTSIGAFLILSFSGFPVFEQLGLFTALGIFFSFLFVHSVFPRIFPTMPAGSNRKLPLRGLVSTFYHTGKIGAGCALLLAMVLVWFARPEFYTSLSSMNTVSEATVAADDLFKEVWGDGGRKIHMMNEAESIAALQSENDLILAQIEDDLANDVLAGGFVPSMIFPGSSRAEQNLSAWHAFWDRERVATLEEKLSRTGESLGFTSEAFNAFLALLEQGNTLQPQNISVKYFDLLGIAEKEEGNGLRQFITFLPDQQYSIDGFFSRYGDYGAIFDGDGFADRLAEILVSTFTTMLAIIAFSATLLLLIFYVNLPLTVLTLLPPLFAYVCTLGTLKLLGHPLDIPALMLAIVVFGMGIDYSIFCVRAHQRYRLIDHPSYALIRMAVFMAGSSTLIGFGVLCFAEHSLLNSIGLTSLLGIGYALFGTFLLLPPLLQWYFDRSTGFTRSQKKNTTQWVIHRFRLLEAYPRLFARLKLRFDPLFTDLTGILKNRSAINTILDIGCGYGVPACWCLGHFKDARLYGYDPDPERVRVANLATAERGIITAGWAPEMPDVKGDVDIALLLDMLHYLDDEILVSLITNVRKVLGSQGVLISRYVIYPSDSPSWSWRLEDFRVKSAGQKPYYRSPEVLTVMLEKLGFIIEKNEVSLQNPELYWLVARVDKG